MAEKTTSKDLKNAERKDLPGQPPYSIVFTGTGIPGGLSDSQLTLTGEEDWSKEFDR